MAGSRHVRFATSTISHAITDIILHPDHRSNSPGRSALKVCFELTPQLRHDEEVTAIRERLDHICSLLSVRLFDSNSNTLTGGSNPPFGGYPMDESIISRNWRMEFPFMTVQTPSTMVLVRLNPTLAAQLVTMERTDVASLTPSDSSSEFRFQYQSAIR